MFYYDKGKAPIWVLSLFLNPVCFVPEPLPHRREQSQPDAFTIAVWDSVKKEAAKHQATEKAAATI